MIKLTGKPHKMVVLFFSTFLFYMFPVSSGIASTGVLLMVKGKASVISRDRSVSAKTGLKLDAGDIVKSFGGSATILLSDGNVKKIQNGQLFKVPASNEKEKKEMLVSRLFNTIKETTEIGRGPTVKGMVRGQEEALITSPHNSFVRLNDLTFDWELPKGAENVTVIIKSRKPKFRYAFEVASKKNRVNLPVNAPPLQPGVRYYWKVEGFHTSEDQAFSTKLCWFSILDSTETAKLKNELNEIDGIKELEAGALVFLKATLFVTYGLYQDAEKVLKGHLSDYPDDEYLRELLAGVYVKMKKFSAAEAFHIQ